MAVNIFSKDGILEAYRHVEVTKYTQLSVTIIIVYDHILMFDSEVELIWKARWSTGRILYFIIRYYTMLSMFVNNYGFFSSNLTNSFCQRFFQWQGWTGLLSCAIAEIILQVRLYAMYHNNKAVLALMVTAFIASITTSGYIIGRVLGDITAIAVPIPTGKFCFPIGVWDKFYLFWAPMLFFECILCGLALSRGIQAFIFDRSQFRNGHNLIRVLLRDSVLYFFVMCATYLTCLLVWLLAPLTLLEVPVTFSVGLSCALGTRLILNVREMRNEIFASTHHTGGYSSHHNYYSNKSQTQLATSGTLSQFEMDQLRSMRADPWIPGKSIY